MVLFLILESFAVCSHAASAESTVSAELTAPAETEGIGSEYNAYISQYEKVAFAEKSIVLHNAQIIGGAKLSEKEGKAGAELSSECKEITYAFDVPSDALYNLRLTYYDLLKEDLSLRAGFYFDGRSPYTELENVPFSKIWENGDKTVKTDEFGNEIRPTQVEKQHFNTEWAESETGMYEKPYAVYLSAGKHTLTVRRVLGSMLISEISLEAFKAPPSYEEYIKNYSSFTDEGDTLITLEAEDAYEVSDSTLAATVNSTDAGMSPASSTTRVVNGIGQQSWVSNGQWVSYKVPEDAAPGLYRISFRAKQTGSVGITSYRSLSINGEIPFAQAGCIGFDYDSKWQIKRLGDDDKDYCVYLEPGDILKLEATTGEMAQSLNKIYTAMDRLNEIYQSIIILTGTSPDENRDYNIKQKIPTLLDDMAAAKEQIDSIADDIAKIMGENNTKVYFFRRFSALLDKLIKNHRKIVPQLDTFKEYIDSFAAQTYDFNSMPLELDRIFLYNSGAELPKADAGFFKSLKFELERFAYTFAKQYNADSFTASRKKGITVWCSLGRDQAQAVKSIIENDFIPNSGINVNFKMTAVTLSEAILAGREPDVSLTVTQDVPVDLALRGQVLDLTDYLKTLSDEYMEQFNESAWIPFRYRGGTYAIPILQDYYMMFYRKDILAKLGIPLPNTWDEFYDVVRELQKSNFRVGIREADSASAGVSTAIFVYDMFLYQNGGRYFNDDLTETRFESAEGKAAFKSLVELYRDYKLNTDFNPITRFRSGEMPIILTGYSFYQTVASTAQEISGRWGMACIPGTLKADGTVDRTETGNVSGAVILKGAERRGLADEAFKFLTWWADSDVQYRYITAMEAIQGVAGRLTTANKKTFDRLSWTDSEADVLKAQRAWVTSINQVPGSYIINRSITNALRTSYESTAIDPLRQLSIQNMIINEELTRKRAEFEKNN